MSCRRCYMRDFDSRNEDLFFQFKATPTINNEKYQLVEGRLLLVLFSKTILKPQSTRLHFKFTSVIGKSQDLISLPSKCQKSILPKGILV